MIKTKNSKVTKVISGVVSLATAVMMMGPAVVSAATVEELTAQINALMAQLQSVQGGSSTTMAASCSYTFSKTLKQGMTDAEVKSLQSVLNMDAATQVAASGVGSKGMETSYFGGMTKAAVVKFQEKYASEILTPNGLTKGTGLVGASTRAKLNTMCTTASTGGTGTGTGSGTGTTGTTTTGTSAVSAVLDGSSPVQGSVIVGASMKIAVFKLTNMGSAPAKVTSVKMKRTGVSSDTTLRNVYLYSGDTRITDSASVATGVINFSDNSGIVTVPAMSSVMLGVVAEIDSSASNVSQTIGVMLTDVTTDGGAVSGLPISAAQHMVVAAPSGMTTVSFNSTTNPSASGNVDPQVDYVVWQNTVQIGSRDALLSALRFRQTGSVSSGDLKNFRLYVDGVQVGSAVDTVNSSQYVDFTFSSPIVMKAGGRTVKLVADVVGGSNKTFAFTVQQAVDSMFWDSQLNVVVAPLVGSSAFSAVAAASQTVNQGTLTITKTSDSPSGNIVLQGTGLTLGKFTLKAAGEKLKVENLRVTFAHVGSVGSPSAQIRNGALFANGVQVGSTQSININNATTPYTQYNLGSSLMVEPGKDVTLEIRGDVYNTAATSTGQFAANDTITVSIAAGSSNVYKTSSYGYFSNSAAAASTVTVASGSMTVAKATSYANQTVVVPQTAAKIGEFNITTGSTEGLNLNQFTLDFTSPGASSGDVTKLQDVYIAYGSKTTVIKSTVASTSNTYSINENVPANTTMSVKIYATLNTGLNSSTNIITNLAVSGTSLSSGNAATASSVQGQTITAGTGALTVATDSSTPVATILVGNSMPKVASFKFTASNDSFTIVDLTATTTDASSISELVFKDGATEIGRQPFNGTIATKTGLSIAVPANTNKVIDVYANLGSVGTNAGNTGGNVSVTLAAVKYRNSNGIETTSVYPGGKTGNAMYVYKTKPTISLVALPTTVLAAGTQTIAKFSITADAGGSINWDKITLNVTTAGGVNATGSIALYDNDDQNTALGTSTVSGGTVSFNGVNKSISGTKTYVVKATVAGNITTGASVSASILGGGTGYAAPATRNAVASTAATFVWSDEAIIGHDYTTADWNNDYLIKNIPTDSQTMTK